MFHRLLFVLVAVVLLLVQVIFGGVINTNHDINDTNITGPQQIHLAGTTDVSSMVVNWASVEECNNDTVVYYGLSATALTFKQMGHCWQFTDGNPLGVQFLHQSTLTQLNELTTYYYTVSSANIESATVYHFKTLSSSPDFVPRILLFGDLGHKGGRVEHELFTALPAMTDEVSKGNVDLLFHYGDFAYDLHDDGGTRGDTFMRGIQPMAAYVPYYTCVGNHEPAYNFSHYRNRFHMPGHDDDAGFRMWYSFDIGQIHIIAWSTEVLFYRQQDIDTQLDWLQQDLIAANQNRGQRPWIITIAHRPMYCSNADHDCLRSKSAGEQVRNYVEVLFNSYGVDIQIYGHEHSYERTWPVFDFQVTQKNYSNALAPIHLISGAAGCNESDGLCLNPILESKGDWSAFRTSGIFHPYSYGFLYAYNRTNVYFNQINAQLHHVYDEINIVQEHHGPFQELHHR